MYKRQDMTIPEFMLDQFLLTRSILWINCFWIPVPASYLTVTALLTFQIVLPLSELRDQKTSSQTEYQQCPLIGELWCPVDKHKFILKVETFILYTLYCMKNYYSVIIFPLILLAIQFSCVGVQSMLLIRQENFNVSNRNILLFSLPRPCCHLGAYVNCLNIMLRLSLIHI